MIKYNEETNRIIIDNDEYNCNDEADMRILTKKIDNRIRILEAIETPSITWNDIVASTDWVEDDLVNAPIFACSWAGDIYGFNVLGADYKSIYLIQNNYYRSGI